MNQIVGHSFIIFEKVRCSGQLLLKLWAEEVTTSLHWKSSRSTWYQTHRNSKLGNTVFWRLLSNSFEMLFSQPTPKWRLCKIFAKLNSNYLLMTNIFKLHQYKTFGLMKMHNMCKIWFANNILSLWKRLVYD